MDWLRALDTPFRCKSLHLKNRFAMAPMSRVSAPDGVPTDAMAAYYRRRAEGGAGLIFSEGVGLDRPSSRHLTAVPNLYGGAALTAWGRVLSAVHDADAAMAPQLWHVGGHADPLGRGAPHAPLESPSGWIGPANMPGGRPMTLEDIADVIAAFARAATDAKALGFDAVELHAAHGYLIDQFFWDETNRRSDAYGGPELADRVRFGVDLVRAVRRAVGEDFVLIMRISQWKLYTYDARIANEPGQLEPWLAPLLDAGVDIFDCSQRRFWEPAFAGSDLNLAGWVKKLVGAPTITVGSVGLDRDVMSDFDGGESAVNIPSLAELARRFERGDFDIVAIGRALLADPHWLRKVREGRLGELQPYSTGLADQLY